MFAQDEFVLSRFSHAGWFGHVARLQGRRKHPAKCGAAQSKGGKLKALENAERLKEEISAAGCSAGKRVHESSG